MKVKELKELLKNIPDDVELHITDMENFDITNFELATYYEDNSYLDIIMPVYIDEYTNENGGESFIADIDKIADFLTLSKEEFLKSYSYLTEFDYEETKKEFHDNLFIRLNYLWDRIEQKMIDEEVDVSHIKQAVLDYAEKNLCTRDYKEFCKNL